MEKPAKQKARAELNSDGQFCVESAEDTRDQIQVRPRVLVMHRAENWGPEEV